MIQELREDIRRQHLATKESRTSEEKDVDEAEDSGVDKNMVQVILLLGSNSLNSNFCFSYTVQQNGQLFSLSKLYVIEPLKSCPEATTCLY